MPKFLTDPKDAINQRAAELGCIVVNVKPDVVLAKRTSDGSFITWEYMLDNDTGKANFFWGHYDMDFNAADKDYDSRG